MSHIGDYILVSLVIKDYIFVFSPSFGDFSNSYFLYFRKENKRKSGNDICRISCFKLVYSVIGLLNLPVLLDLIGSLGLSASGNDVCRMSAGNMTTPTQFRQNVLKVHEKKFC